MTRDKKKNELTREGVDSLLLWASGEMDTGLSGLLLLLWALPWAEGAKVLVFPMEGSQWLSMKDVTRELHARSHQIVFLAPDVTLYIKGEDFFTLQTYHPFPYTQEEYQQNILGNTKKAFEAHFVKMFFETMAAIRKISEFYANSCAVLLYNETLIQ